MMSQRTKDSSSLNHRYITKGIGNSPTRAIQSVHSARAIRVGINHMLTSTVAFIVERKILVFGIFLRDFLAKRTMVTILMSSLIPV